jgi:glycosyltransferase involved in cell wall biosynthesis
VSPDPDDALTRHSTMIKVTEYVAGGLACLIADLPENRVTAGDAALYFRAGDADDLARRLEELIDKPELVQELSRKAAARGPAVAWPSSADRLVAAYRRLLDRGPELSGEQVLVG